MIGTHVIDISDGSLKTAQDLLDTHFRGLHVSAAALQAAYPSGSSGDYANVDPGGTGTDTSRYIWDVDDSQWILGSSGGLDHTHSNKAILDATTASFTTSDETTVDKFTLSTDLIAIPDGFRPGLFTGAGAASGSIFESSVDGHLWWKHRDDSLHLLCDTSPYGAAAVWGSITGTLADQTDLNAALNLKAPSLNPVFTGLPHAPTAAIGTSTVQIATTEFVANGLALKANLASPTFTGSPSGPTAPAGTATTQFATTAFVDAAVAGAHTHTLSDVTDSGALAGLNTVGAAQIDANAVTTVKILDDNVTADKLADTTVSAGAYTNADLTVDAQGRITSCSNGSSSGTTWGTITGTLSSQTDLGDLAALDEVDTAQIATDAVTTSEIATNGVHAGNINASAVTNSKLADNSVNGDKLAQTAVAAGSYTNCDLTVDAQGRLTAAASGSSSATTWGTITGTLSAQTDLGDLAALDTVDTDQIDDDAVTAAKLADTTVSAGAYTTADITVDAQGRITSASSGSSSASIGSASSVSAPGLPVVSDSDTGLYSPAADQLGITVGGVDAFFASEIAGVVYMNFEGDHIGCDGGYTGSEKFGSHAEVSAQYATVVGGYASATASSSAAYGFAADATAILACALGYSADASADSACGIGSRASATAVDSTAVGTDASASGISSVAVGNDANVSSLEGVAVGDGADSSGSYAIAIGVNSSAAVHRSIAIGRNANVSAGLNSVLIGPDSQSDSSNAVGIGNSVEATADGSIAIGAVSVSDFDYSIALGMYTSTETANTMCIGGAGSNTYVIKSIFIGNGETSGVAPTYDVKLQATSGAGTNIGGKTLIIAGGSPTGNASGGEVIIQTAQAGSSGSATRTLVDRVTVKEDGDVSFNGNNVDLASAVLSGDMILDSPTTPASASAFGTKGMVSWDSSYLYVCTATNTWKRVAIATW